MKMLDFMGGAWQNFTLDGSVYGSWGTAYHMDADYAWNYKRVWAITPQNATAYLRLPNAVTWNIPEGGPTFYFENLDAATYGVRIYSPTGLYLGEVGPQNAPNYNRAVVFCVNNETNIWKGYNCRDSGLVRMA